MITFFIFDKKAILGYIMTSYSCLMIPGIKYNQNKEKGWMLEIMNSCKRQDLKEMIIYLTQRNI